MESIENITEDLSHLLPPVFAPAQNLLLDFAHHKGVGRHGHCYPENVVIYIDGQSHRITEYYNKDGVLEIHAEACDRL